MLRCYSSTCVQICQTGCWGLFCVSSFAGIRPTHQAFLRPMYCMSKSCAADCMEHAEVVRSAPLFDASVHIWRHEASLLSHLTHSCPHKNKLVAWKSKNNNNNVLHLEYPPLLPFNYLIIFKCFIVVSMIWLDMIMYHQRYLLFRSGWWMLIALPLRARKHYQPRAGPLASIF